MTADGLFYKHDFRNCHRVTYDALPMLRCHGCQSLDVVVVLDAAKGAAELAELQKTGGVLENHSVGDVGGPAAARIGVAIRLAGNEKSPPARTGGHQQVGNAHGQ